MKKQLPTNNKITDWMGKFDSNLESECCIRYALTFNLLNTDWLDDILDLDITYGSQSVLNTINGIENYLSYLSGKIKTLKNSDKKVIADLGTSIENEPCVLFYQSLGNYDMNWLENPIAYVTFKCKNNSLIKDIFMVTTAPSPKSVEKSEIYPGLKEKPIIKIKKIIRNDETYENLKFTYFLYDGELSLDKKMINTIPDIQTFFEGCEIEIVFSLRDSRHIDIMKSYFNGIDVNIFNIDKGSGWDLHMKIVESGFVGFPSLSVYWDNNIIFKNEGILSSEIIKQEVQQIIE